MNISVQPKNPVIAALLNAFLLVLGYVYLGQGKKATVVFGIIIVCSATVILMPLALVIWGVAIVDAYLLARRLEHQSTLATYEFFWSRPALDLIKKDERNSETGDVEREMPLESEPFASRQWISLRVAKAKPYEEMLAGSIRLVQENQIRNLSFSPGHPRLHVVYAAHPTVATLYYPVAQFHRMTLEHKCAEAIKMLTYLGASQLEVEHVRGWSKELDINFAALFEKVGIKLGSKPQMTEHLHQLIFTATLQGSETPSLPLDLSWYDYEPTWQRVAEARLMHGLQSFTLDLRYEDNFGVSAQFLTKLVTLGFEIGGSVEEHQSTVWRIRGTFANSSVDNHKTRSTS
jgi:hypothetical protein